MTHQLAIRRLTLALEGLEADYDATIEDHTSFDDRVDLKIAIDGVRQSLSILTLSRMERLLTPDERRQSRKEKI